MGLISSYHCNLDATEHKMLHLTETLRIILTISQCYYQLSPAGVS